MKIITNCLFFRSSGVNNDPALNQKRTRFFMWFKQRNVYPEIIVHRWFSWTEQAFMFFPVPIVLRSSGWWNYSFTCVLRKMRNMTAIPKGHPTSVMIYIISGIQSQVADGVDEQKSFFWKTQLRNACSFTVEFIFPIVLKQLDRLYTVNLPYQISEEIVNDEWNEFDLESRSGVSNLQ